MFCKKPPQCPEHCSFEKCVFTDFFFFTKVEGTALPPLLTSQAGVDIEKSKVESPWLQEI